MSEINERNEFLLEILVEELPTTEVDGLISQLQEKVETLLKNENIKYEKIETFIAPRRFGFVITGLPDSTPDKLIEKKGPAINVAFDENKQPTKALLGFLKSNNSCLDEVKIVENYVYILKVQRGIKIDEFLKNNVPGMITSLRFRKPMRWGNGKYEFVRIPHNVFAIYNGKTIDMKIFDIPATNKTVGHRFVMDEYFEIESSEEYFSKLREYYVIAKLEDRIEFIKAQLDEFEKSGFQVDKDHELIKEVAILTEYPKLITGTFDEKFLNLPQELIKTTIKHHQRSFTVQKEGDITNIFIAFIDMPSDKFNNARKGYERVINARLEDARYYYEKDIRIKLSQFNEKLKDIVFQKELGTLFDKVERVEQITKDIVEILNLNKIGDKIRRTAQLCKADIGSHVVYEFPELQGIMGRIYALKDGEDKDVAYGIEEHYSNEPTTVEGAVVGIADRIDTIIGNFIIGNIPSGSKDPYGLRGKTDDIFKIIEKFEWDLDLEMLIKKGCKMLGSEIPDSLLEFFETRFELYNTKVRYDIARATKHLWKRPLRGILAAQAIHKLVGKEEFENLLTGFERVHNISKKHNSDYFDSEKFLEEAEKRLFEKYIEIKPLVIDALEHLNYDTALEKLILLRPYVDSYFDKVFVMTDQEDIRLNRLGFLKALDKLFMEIGDLTLIEKI